jgi:hypothetical protein
VQGKDRATTYSVKLWLASRHRHCAHPPLRQQLHLPPRRKRHEGKKKKKKEKRVSRVKSCLADQVIPRAR